jgi:preprotein translocase subunit SecB
MIVAQKPPLQLEGYFYNRVLCEIDPDYNNKKKGKEIKLGLTVKNTIAHQHKNPRSWKVILDIDVKSPNKTVPYRVELQLVGFFKVAQDVPENKIESHIRITGASILYSGAREFLLGITSRGPYTPLSLPTISFVEPDRIENFKEKKGSKVGPKKATKSKS